MFLYQGFGIKNVSNKMSGFMDEEKRLKFHAITQYKKARWKRSETCISLSITEDSIWKRGGFKRFQIVHDQAIQLGELKIRKLAIIKS